MFEPIYDLFTKKVDDEEEDDDDDNENISLKTLNSKMDEVVS